jgi:hypothetical protein
MNIGRWAPYPMTVAAVDFAATDSIIRAVAKELRRLGLQGGLKDDRSLRRVIHEMFLPRLAEHKNVHLMRRVKHVGIGVTRHPIRERLKIRVPPSSSISDLTPLFGPVKPSRNAVQFRFFTRYFLDPIDDLQSTQTTCACVFDDVENFLNTRCISAPRHFAKYSFVASPGSHFTSLKSTETDRFTRVFVQKFNHGSFCVNEFVQFVF